MTETRGDRGVSPVIGVVLMVAIVVVLAATVGAFVLQYGEADSEIRPQIAATTAYDQRTTGNGEYLNVTFQSGDVLDTQNLTLTVTGAHAVDPSGSRVSVSVVDDHLESEVGTEVRASDEVSINADAVRTDSGGALGPNDHLDLRGATVRLVWNPPDSEVDESATIWRWERG